MTTTSFPRALMASRFKVEGSTFATCAPCGSIGGRRERAQVERRSPGITLASGCRHEFIVAATHGLFVGKAVERLNRPETLRALVTDSLPFSGLAPGRLTVVRLASLLAEAVRRIVSGRPLDGLLAAR